MQLAAPRVTVTGNDVSWGHLARSEEGTRSEEGMRLVMEERGKPHRALIVTPLQASGLDQASDSGGAGSLAITNDRIRGPSVDTLVEVTEGVAAGRASRFAQVLVSGNVIEHWSPPDNQGARATVELRAMAEALVSVSANVVRGSGRTPSVQIDGPREIAWCGNATSGQLIGAAGNVKVTAYARAGPAIRP